MYKSMVGKCPGMVQAPVGLGTLTRVAVLLRSFQLAGVSRKALFKTYLVVIDLLHPHAEPAMAKDKHRYPEGSQH